MNSWMLIAHEAKIEIRAGLKSGIVALAFWGLVLYLLICLTNADYMQKMGATNIPLNSPSLIYLMGAGCMCFNFFAWAWVFSQPILRDRKANLHEVILTAPHSVKTMFWGRFIGAAVIGIILSASAIVGFLFSPILVWMGLIPAAAIGPMPYLLLLYTWLWLLVPVSVGIGALYMFATLRTRSLSGPFGCAALLMMLWMFAIIVLQGGGINPQMAAMIDPSLFTFVFTEVGNWTPLEKSSSLLPFTTGAVLNRLIWCLLPLILLAWYLRNLKREDLVLDNSEKALEPSKKTRLKINTVQAVSDVSMTFDNVSSRISLRQLTLEVYWCLMHIWRSRGWWIGMSILVCLGVMSSFTQIIWHAEGPMIASLQLLLPMLKELMFLVFAFVISALTGLIYRRDHVPGFEDMIGATASKDYVRIFGIAISVFLMTVMMSLLPAISSLIVVLISAPAAIDISQALVHQLLIVAPPYLEVSMMVLLAHALIRHAGFAYALSMFVTLIMVVNHELELVHYPPYKLGIAAHINWSSLSEWTPWLSYLLTLDSFKFLFALLMVGFAALLVPRGLDSRLAKGCAQLRGRLIAPQGVIIISSIFSLLVLGMELEKKLVQQGGYVSLQQQQQQDAAWEKKWLPRAEGVEVAGGFLSFSIDTDSQIVRGEWLLEKVKPERHGLHFGLPHGLEPKDVWVNGKIVIPEISHDHMFVPLQKCGSSGCMVKLTWQWGDLGWSAEGQSWGLGKDGIWLNSEAIAPTLGFAPERLLRAPTDRVNNGLNENYTIPSTDSLASLDGIAPSAYWRWQWNINHQGQQVKTVTGETKGPLDFSILWSKNVKHSYHLGLEIIHDKTREDRVSAVAEDVTQMLRCVNQYLGQSISVEQVAQWPSGLDEIRYSQGRLQLTERPHWDVSENGSGRLLRRVDIARALAEKHINAKADLRRGYGSAWLNNGLSGAIGLLCIAHTDGLTALHQVLVRYTDKTTQALSASEVPVGRLNDALVSGWARYYAPVAALNWTIAQTPSSLSDLFADIKQQSSIESLLIAELGHSDTDKMLGVPLSSSLTVKHLASGKILLTGKRWRWKQDGWQLMEESARFHLFDGRKILGEQEYSNENTVDKWPETDLIVFDIWPGYSRDPKQNLLKGYVN